VDGIEFVCWRINWEDTYVNKVQGIPEDFTIERDSSRGDRQTDKSSEGERDGNNTKLDVLCPLTGTLTHAQMSIESQAAGTSAAFRVKSHRIL
jgi:hypothetical protein